MIIEGHVVWDNGGAYFRNIAVAGTVFGQGTPTTVSCYLKAEVIWTGVHAGQVAVSEFEDYNNCGGRRDDDVYYGDIDWSDGTAKIVVPDDFVYNCGDNLANVHVWWADRSEEMIKHECSTSIELSDYGTIEEIEETAYGHVGNENYPVVDTEGVKILQMKANDLKSFKYVAIDDACEVLDEYTLHFPGGGLNVVSDSSDWHLITVGSFYDHVQVPIKLGDSLYCILRRTITDTPNVPCSLTPGTYYREFKFVRLQITDSGFTVTEDIIRSDEVTAVGVTDGIGGIGPGGDFDIAIANPSRIYAGGYVSWACSGIYDDSCNEIGSRVLIGEWGSDVLDEYASFLVDGSTRLEGQTVDANGVIWIKTNATGYVFDNLDDPIADWTWTTYPAGWYMFDGMPWSQHADGGMIFNDPWLADALAYCEDMPSFTDETNEWIYAFSGSTLHKRDYDGVSLESTTGLYRVGWAQDNEGYLMNDDDDEGDHTSYELDEFVEDTSFSVQPDIEEYFPNFPGPDDNYPSFQGYGTVDDSGLIWNVGQIAMCTDQILGLKKVFIEACSASAGLASGDTVKARFTVDTDDDAAIPTTAVEGYVHFEGCGINERVDCTFNGTYLDAESSQEADENGTVTCTAYITRCKGYIYDPDEDTCNSDTYEFTDF